MGDSKTIPIVGGVMLLLFLPLIIVIALLLGVLTGMDTAAACTPTSSAGSGCACNTDGPLVGGNNQEKAAGNMIHESQVTPTLLNGDTPPKETLEFQLKTVEEAAPGKPGVGPSIACAAGSGNIAEVAKSLAWPDDGHTWHKSDATEAYQQALPKWNSENGYNVWSDCGRFVATVMRMSGADPEYPMVSTDTQNIYLRTSGKYDVYDNLEVGELLPGDIFIGPGHTYLFVGQWGQYNAASGSLETGRGTGHVPEAGYAYDVGGYPTGFAVARLKK